LHEHCEALIAVFDDPWLSAFVPDDPEAELPPDAPAVIAPDPAKAIDAGYTELVARQAAMALELAPGGGEDDVEEGIDLATVGAVNDAAYGGADRHLERVLGCLPPGSVRAYGRGGHSVALVLDRDDDANVQYVATLPEAQRAGHAEAVLRHALAAAARRGQRTSTLTASDEGRRLYEKLGYQVVGWVELRRRRTN
jgi:ribosomal protein S18 acetylase RimI-like enzyme